MTAYWHPATDWGTDMSKRYFVRPLADGQFAVEDGDTDKDAPPVAVFFTQARAQVACKNLARNRKP